MPKPLISQQWNLMKSNKVDFKTYLIVSYRQERRGAVEREREGEIEQAQVLLSAGKWPEQSVLSRWELKIKNFFHVFQDETGVQIFGPSHSMHRELDMKWSGQDINCCSYDTQCR